MSKLNFLFTSRYRTLHCAIKLLTIITLKSFLAEGNVNKHEIFIELVLKMW